MRCPYVSDGKHSGGSGAERQGLSALSPAKPLLVAAGRVIATCAALSLIDCSSATAPRGTAPQLAVTPISPVDDESPDNPASNQQPPLLATLIDRVPEGTFGPYLGTSDAGTVVALWATQDKTAGHRWFSVPLSAQGSALGKPRDLGPAPGDLGLVRVAPTAEGFVALSTVVAFSGTRIEALLLGAEGELAAGPAPIVHSRTEVLWLEALSVADSSVIVWATLAAGAADLHLAPLGKNGALQAGAATVFENVRAWQAVTFGDGIAVAAIVAGEDGGSRGLSVRFLDTDGRRLAETQVSDSTSINSEIDAAAVSGQLLVAWSEQVGLDSRLQLASLGSDTRLLEAPSSPLRPQGSQRLLEIVPPSDPRSDAFLAWENVNQAPPGTRQFSLARLSRAAALSEERALLSFHGGGAGRPELASRGDGLAALTRAPACAATAKDCETPAVPTYVEFDRGLNIVASEPLHLTGAEGQAAELGWGLHCQPKGCSALAALAAAPVPVFGVELRARSDHWKSAAITPAPASLPEAGEISTLSELDPIAAIATRDSNDETLVAWLTQFDPDTPYERRTSPAPDGRLAPLRAQLNVQPFGSDGAPRGKVNVVSYRARSAGGLALAEAPMGRSLLVWAALDQTQPEVFVTLLNTAGRRLNQRMLTRSKGEISAVAAAATARGFTVVWIDDRDGPPEVFSAAITAGLARGARQQQLSFAPQRVEAISLMPWKDSALLARVSADPDGTQRLLLSALSASNGSLSEVGQELSVSREGSLSEPHLVRDGQGAALAWIERPGGGGAVLGRLLRLDANAKPAGSAATLKAQAGATWAARLLCGGGTCRGVLDTRGADGHHLSGFAWNSEENVTSKVLWQRATRAADPAAVSLSAHGIFYADRRGEGGLVRRMTVKWP